MKSFKYKGKYDGKEENLPQREHPEGYVPFKEPDNIKKLSAILNIVSLLFFIITIGGLFLRTGGIHISIAGIFVSLLCMIPHEFLHGICFKGDVYMYQNLKKGMLFVVSTEDLSKSRFVFLSLLPNLVFGFIPYIIFLINPDFIFLGTLGALSIPCGAGDYLNAFNALTQMPKNAVTYLSGMHSYWYIPNSK